MKLIINGQCSDYYKLSKFWKKNKVSQLLESTLRSQTLESTAPNCYYFFVKYFIHFFHKLCSDSEN